MTGTGTGAGRLIADGLRLREANRDDLPAILTIYEHHVLQGLGSFELEPPDLATMTERYESLVVQGFPYLVAAERGRVQGYAHAGPYRPRPAYRFAVENSVYVAPEYQRRGIGRQLLKALIERCTRLGYRRMVAVIGDSNNLASVRLHEKQGFERAGLIPSVGLKLGRWVDVVILQRPLGEGGDTLPE